MREYNVQIRDGVVVGIAEEVIKHLEQYPGYYSVECIVTKVILDGESPFCDESIVKKAEETESPLLFNGEEVDQLGFIRRMFEMRKELISRVTAYVRKIIPDDLLTIADQQEIRDLISKDFLTIGDRQEIRDLISNIAKIVSTFLDNFW